MLVELGGGTNPHPRADVVIDLHHPKNAPRQDATLPDGMNTPYWRVDRNHPLSAGDTGYIRLESADEIYASHFMEHVPKGTPLIVLMNEAWRVLRPGGTFTMILPLIGYTDPITGHGHLVNGWQPFADPTHVQFWWFPESLLYFCQGPFKPHADYGIREWAPLGTWGDSLANPGISFWWVRDGWEGVARLVKP